jgi:P27 family predicted phage terminase small subunit
MVGRKPKPSNLRILEGMRGHRPLNDREPKPERKAPACPRLFRGQERKAWRYLVRELGKMGILASSDLGIMAAYCHWWGIYVAAEEELRHLELAAGKKALLLKDKNTGKTYQNPYLSIAGRAARELTRVCGDLGLNPVQRTRIKTEKTEAQSLADELSA